MQEFRKTTAEGLKLFNVFGVATVREAQIGVLAVSVVPNRATIERSVHREIQPIAGVEGAHQVLFGANLRTGRPAEIAVFQIQRTKGENLNLFEHPEVRKAIHDVVEKVRVALNK